MTKGIIRYRPPPAFLLRRLHDHRRWLDSNGEIGARIGGNSSIGEFKFQGLDLESVEFSLGRLSHIEFHGCNLRNTWWVNAAIEGTMFVGCDLEGARFSQADMHLAYVLDSNIRSAVFDGVSIENVFWNDEQVEAYRRAEDERRTWTKTQWDRFESEGEERVKLLRDAPPVSPGRTRAVITREELSFWRTIRSSALTPLEP